MPARNTHAFGDERPGGRHPDRTFAAGDDATLPISRPMSRMLLRGAPREERPADDRDIWVAYGLAPVSSHRLLCGAFGLLVFCRFRDLGDSGRGLQHGPRAPILGRDRGGRLRSLRSLPSFVLRHSRTADIALGLSLIGGPAPAARLAGGAQRLRTGHGAPAAGGHRRPPMQGRVAELARHARARRLPPCSRARRPQHLQSLPPGDDMSAAARVL